MSNTSETRLAEIQIAFSPPLRHLDRIPGMRADRGAFVYRIRRDGRVHMSGSCHGSELGRGGAPRALHRAVEAALGAGYTHFVIRGEEETQISLPETVKR